MVNPKSTASQPDAAALPPYSGQNPLVRFMNRFRTKSRQLKLATFFRCLPLRPGARLLDVGGGWGLFLEAFLEKGLTVVVVDIDEASLRSIRARHPQVSLVLASGTDLPFKDQAFQGVFSNAVLEHVGPLPAQARFASEVNRVGQSYFVTTPNKLFPFEFHFGLPAYQFVPRPLQRLLAQGLGLGLWYDRGKWEDIRLLTSRQVARLFPGGKVIAQRVTFMAETLIAVKATKAREDSPNV